MPAHVGREPIWFGDIQWHPRAACSGLGNRPDVWFLPPEGRIIRSDVIREPRVLAALELCWNECPVRELCWQQAAEDPHSEGVWGGEFWPSGWTAHRERAKRGPIQRPA